MTATDAQVRIAMREREKGRTQEQAAASANLVSHGSIGGGHPVIRWEAFALMGY
jgi:hypothetical protein